MRERSIYRGVIVTLLVLFVVFFSISHHNYMKMVECNDDLLNLIDEQRTRHESVIKLWEEAYSDLEDAYCRVAMENSKLRESNIIPFTKEEVYMLAQCVEAEAGHYNAHSTSQRYVTQVILNRLHSEKFPDSLKEVIYQKSGNIPQFSVAYNGMMDREVEPETLANVYSVLLHGTDLPEYVCYFYDDSVTGNWINTLPIHDTVEGTVFAYESKEE